MPSSVYLYMGKIALCVADLPFRLSFVRSHDEQNNMEKQLIYFHYDNKGSCYVQSYHYKG
jgi:hypothetical protein